MERYIVQGDRRDFVDIPLGGSPTATPDYGRSEKR